MMILLERQIAGTKACYFFLSFLYRLNALYVKEYYKTRFTFMYNNLKRTEL